MVSANVRRVDVSFSKSVPGRMRLTNQLRGKVTLCNTPSELTPRAMTNNPESLSTRSHNTIGSTRSRLRRTSLRGQIRGGAHRSTYPVVHTVDTTNRRSMNNGLWRSKTRRDPVRWNGPLDDAGIVATISTCTSAYEWHNSRHFLYRCRRLACMQPRTSVWSDQRILGCSVRGSDRRLQPILVQSRDHQLPRVY